jgi:hypothetical protein
MLIVRRFDSTTSKIIVMKRFVTAWDNEAGILDLDEKLSLEIERNANSALI